MRRKWLSILLIICTACQALAQDWSEALSNESLDAVPAATLPDGKALPPMDDEWDWVELTSGEWLKGTIEYMYEEEMSFDSDVLGELTLDWDDIKSIYSTRIMEFRLDNRTTVAGVVSMQDGQLEISGIDDEVNPDEVVSMVPQAGGELKNWSLKASIGADFQSGNTREVAYSMSLEAIRRTALTRYSFFYTGNYKSNQGIVTANNQFANTFFDYFLDKDIFIRPILLQYNRDTFSNISFQGTAGAGIGYQIHDGPKFDWDVFAGPTYVYTRYSNVQTGQRQVTQTPAALVQTTLSYDITGDLTYTGNYQIIAMDKNSGLLTSNFITTLEYELNDIFDVVTTFTWQRIQNPTTKADGTTPEQDDFFLTFGLGVSY